MPDLKKFKHLFKKLAKLISNFIFIKYRDPEYIFTKIYKEKNWHSDDIKSSEYCSGSGSDEKFAAPYIKTVIKFINDNNIKTIVDLGCGDFRIGKKIVQSLPQVKYTGIDVVPALIEYLKKENRTFLNVEFLCKNIVRDEIPLADLILIRQVFQHLSNKDILKVLNNLGNNCKSYIIVSEHQLIDNKNVIPNKDKITWGDTRISRNSGVYLDLKPFNKRLKLLLEQNINNKECIRTFLINENNENYNEI